MSASLCSGDGVMRRRSVPRGTERLRITPSPLHSDADIDHLLFALNEIWTKLGVSRSAVVGEGHPLAELCPVVGPLQADPAELGVDSCPFIGDAREGVAQEQVSAPVSTKVTT